MTLEPLATMFWHRGATVVTSGPPLEASVVVTVASTRCAVGKAKQLVKACAAIWAALLKSDAPAKGVATAMPVVVLVAIVTGVESVTVLKAGWPALSVPIFTMSKPRSAVLPVLADVAAVMLVVNGL